MRSSPDVSIPDTVTGIGSNVFEECTSLELISLPPALQSLGGRAFARCTNLQEVTIPATLSAMDAEVFYHASSCIHVVFEGTEGAFKQLIKNQNRTASVFSTIGGVRLHEPVSICGNRYFYTSSEPFRYKVTCQKDGSELVFQSETPD